MKQKCSLLGNLLKIYGIVDSVRLMFFWGRRKYGCRKKKVTSVFCKSIEKRIYFRPYSTDIYLLIDLFCRLVQGNEREYDIEEIFREYGGIQLKKELNTIIDAGANIGLFTMIMKSKYPNSKIICIEPDEDNFALLLKNTHDYENVICIRGGVWKTDAFLIVEDRGTGEWGLVVRECDEDRSTCCAMSISSLCSKYKLSRVDLLKMDIEGAEYEVFNDSSYKEWINKIDLFIIEIHERIHSGAENAIHNKMKNEGFSYFAHGEDTFFYRK